MLKDDVKLRKTISRYAFAILIIWLVLGWDSCAGQLEKFLENLPFYFMGRITWDELVALYHSGYGKTLHWSAFSIYGFCYWALSKYYSEKLDLKGSRNIILAFGFTFLSIGIFEHFWHWSYGILQNQPWVLTWKMPHLRNLFQTIVFTIVGLFIILLISLEHDKLYYLGNWRHIMYYWQPQTFFPKLKLNFNKWTFVLLFLTFGSVLLWWFYPFPIEHFSTEVIGGSVWTNSKYFPQTVYTVETNLLDNINAGVQFYFENNLLHTVNIMAKVLFTLTIYNVGRVKKADQIQEKS